MLRRILLAGLLLILFVPDRASAQGASLYISPAAGTFTVGSTFTASVFVNTVGQNINAVEVDLKFSPDKLQVVNPATGTSIISVWASQPTFSNTEGTVNLTGGIPTPGIATNAGLITTITFRVVGVGKATVRFTQNSKVLLNDGEGTQILAATGGAVYDLKLPPPEGPLVSSPTHPDPERWYRDRNPFFVWDKTPQTQAFSYVLNDRPLDIPDDIPEGDASKVQYNGIGDGVLFFHIKAKSAAGWGGTSHIQIKIDATAPAAFPIEITPRPRTSNRQPVLYFQTTDNLSGLDHYELKLINVSPGGDGAQTPFFIEAQSPHQTPRLELGTYDVIVRAFDRAGNLQESREKLKIVPFFYQALAGRGVSISGAFVVSWPVLWALLLVILILLILIARHIYLRHKRHDAAIRAGRPELAHPISEQMKILLKKQQEYGKKV